MSWFVDRRFRAARIWSNHEIRKLGGLFSGSAVNVSGWDDRDKEGARYQSYFRNIQTYVTTNYSGKRGYQGKDDEIFLDLEERIPDDLVSAFDLVFNHTTIEHIFDIFTAFHNLCLLSRDAVLVVVPFAQVEHFTESFGDYWRFTPQALRRLFEREGMSMVYSSVSPDVDAAIYVLGLGVRDASKWAHRVPPSRVPSVSGTWIGRPGLAARVVRRLGLGSA